MVLSLNGNINKGEGSMIFTTREQRERATEDMYQRLDERERWTRYTTMDAGQNYRQGGEYGKQVIENFKRKKGGDK